MTKNEDKINGTKPYRCPVCEGTGYFGTQAGGTTAAICHACNGDGVLWKNNDKD